MTVGVVVENKKIPAPQMYRLCIQQEQKYTGFTEITFVIAMEDSDNWLAETKYGRSGLGLEIGGHYHRPESIFINQKRRTIGKRNQKKEKT
jgi:hypothetical protein